MLDVLLHALEVGERRGAHVDDDAHAPQPHRQQPDARAEQPVLVERGGELGHQLRVGDQLVDLEQAVGRLDPRQHVDADRAAVDSSGPTQTARATCGEAASVSRSKSSAVTARVRARISSRARSRALSSDSALDAAGGGRRIGDARDSRHRRGRMLSVRGATLPARPPPWR